MLFGPGPGSDPGPIFCFPDPVRDKYFVPRSGPGCWIPGTLDSRIWLGPNILFPDPARDLYFAPRSDPGSNFVFRIQSRINILFLDPVQDQYFAPGSGPGSGINMFLPDPNRDQHLAPETYVCLFFRLLRARQSLYSTPYQGSGPYGALYRAHYTGPGPSIIGGQDRACAMHYRDLERAHYRGQDRACVGS